MPRTNRPLALYQRQFGEDVFADPDATVLDVGAGDMDTGESSPDAASRRLGHVRLDLDYARRPVFDCTAVAGDATALPFPTGCFDLVLCSWAMPYVASPGRVLEEMIRVTAPDGTVMVHPSFHVLTRFAHPFAGAYEKCFSVALGSRPTLVIEKRSGTSEDEWSSLAYSIAATAKLRPNSAARAIRRRYHDLVMRRLGPEVDHRAAAVFSSLVGRPGSTRRRRTPGET